MGYHIGTALILQEFKDGCECPLCKIEKIVNENILFQFLNDAVMEDDTRARVNKLGFCAEHFDMLFARQNKLSVARNGSCQGALCFGSGEPIFVG